MCECSKREAIKAQPQPSLISGVDWTPLLQAALSVAAQALGVQVTPAQAPAQSTPSTSPATPVAQTPGEVQTLRQKIQEMRQDILTRLDRLERDQAEFRQAQTQMMQAITLLAQSQGSNNSNPNNESNNSGSTPASSPTSSPSKTPPTAPAATTGSSLPEITPADPFKAELDLDK